MDINKLLQNYIIESQPIEDVIQEAIDSQSLGDTPESSPKKYKYNDEEEEDDIDT